MTQLNGETLANIESQQFEALREMHKIINLRMLAIETGVNHAELVAINDVVQPARMPMPPVDRPENPRIPREAEPIRQQRRGGFVSRETGSSSGSSGAIGSRAMELASGALNIGSGAAGAAGYIGSRALSAAGTLGSGSAGVVVVVVVAFWLALS